METITKGQIMKPKKQNKIQYNMIVKPAMPINLRHKISKLIEQEGYDVWAEGQFTNESACDINFEKCIDDE